MEIKNYLWALPFFSFLAGYLIIQRFSSIDLLEAPALVGRQLQNAVVELSEKNLNIRLITQKEDPDLPEGTILSQTPISGQKIKPHQALHVVISKKPEKRAAPQLINKSIERIEKELDKVGIRNKSYRLPSNRPTGSCIAQLPTAGTLLQENKITTYISCENKKTVLMPNFKGKSVPEAMDFLQKHNVKTDIMHISNTDKSHICDHNCIINDQRPLAGALVTLKDEKPLLVQLQAKIAHPFA